MRLNQYPIEIINRVLELNPSADLNRPITNNLNYGTTPEGPLFWSVIGNGNVNAFYERYPRKKSIDPKSFTLIPECDTLIQGDLLIIQSFISPSTSKMVINKAQAESLLKEISAFLNPKVEEKKEPSIKKEEKVAKERSSGKPTIYGGWDEFN